MHIVAKVFDIEIYKRDVERECSRMKHNPDKDHLHIALERIIDRCLLFAKAKQGGFEVTDQEYDDALLDLLDQDEPLGLSSEAIQDLSADEMERLLKRYLIIKKYIHTLCHDGLNVTNQKLHEFYDEQREIFLRGECVRCSHILLRNSSDNEAHEVYVKIQNEEDFNRISMTCSDCPSNASCGDLGWFHKGKMIREIEEVAFALKVGEISKPFKSTYGYHILMLKDKREASYIPFDDIRDSLSIRLKQIEKEYILSQHIAELRNSFASQIVIVDSEFIA